MEPSDRVRAALALELPDRPPVAWWGHAYREEWSPSDLAALTVARQRRYRWDFVKLQPRATCFAEAFGSRYRPSGDPLRPPILIEPAIRSSEDWAALRPTAAGQAALTDQVECVRQVASGVGPEVPVIQTVFSPLTVAGYLVGGDRRRAVRDLHDRTDAVRVALDVIAETLAGFAAASVDAGAAGVFYAVSGYASGDVMPEEDYRSMVLPSDVRVFGSLPGRSWFNVLHLCGSAINFDLASAFDAGALSWSVHERGNPSLAEGRDRTGRAVMGGLDHARTLARGSPEAVSAEVRRARRETGDRGLLIAPGCSVPPEAPEENLDSVAAG